MKENALKFNIEERIAYSQILKNKEDHEFFEKLKTLRFDYKNEAKT